MQQNFEFSLFYLHCYLTISYGDFESMQNRKVCTNDINNKYTDWAYIVWGLQCEYIALHGILMEAPGGIFLVCQWSEIRSAIFFFSVRSWNQIRNKTTLYTYFFFRWFIHIEMHAHTVPVSMGGSRNTSCVLQNIKELLCDSKTIIVLGEFKW